MSEEIYPISIAVEKIEDDSGRYGGAIAGLDHALQTFTFKTPEQVIEIVRDARDRNPDVAVVVDDRDFDEWQGAGGDELLAGLRGASYPYPDPKTDELYPAFRAMRSQKRREKTGEKI